MWPKNSAPGTKEGLAFMTAVKTRSVAVSLTQAQSTSELAHSKSLSVKKTQGPAGGGAGDMRLAPPLTATSSSESSGVSGLAIVPAAASGARHRRARIPSSARRRAGMAVRSQARRDIRFPRFPTLPSGEKEENDGGSAGINRTRRMGPP